MTPVEQRLFDAFLDVGFVGAVDRSSGLVAHHQGWMLDLRAQVPIGPYRLDFVLTSSVLDEKGELPFKIVVEVDGPEHDRSAASRADRQRDRNLLLASGATVVRFENAEVAADAESCALQILELAMDLSAPHLDAAFTRHLQRRAAAAAGTA